MVDYLRSIWLLSLLTHTSASTLYNNYNGDLEVHQLSHSTCFIGANFLLSVCVWYFCVVAQMQVSMEEPGMHSTVVPLHGDKTSPLPPALKFPVRCWQKVYTMQPNTLSAARTLTLTKHGSPGRASKHHTAGHSYLLILSSSLFYTTVESLHLCSLCGRKHMHVGVRTTQELGEYLINLCLSNGGA